MALCDSTVTKEGRRLEGEEDDVSGFRTDGIQTNDDGSVTDHKNDAVVLEVELVDEDEEEDSIRFPLPRHSTSTHSKRFSGKRILSLVT